MQILENRIELLDKITIENKLCAEVGVFMGDFSQEILKKNPKRLWLIDPWINQATEIYPDDHSNLTNSQFNQIYAEVKKKFNSNDQIHILREFSYFAAKNFENDVLDFVYIDAIHTYESCLCDALIWFHKVKVGGWLCGHDYTGKFTGVSNAVDAFCRIARHQIDIITSEDWGSWAIQKKAQPLLSQ